MNDRSPEDVLTAAFQHFTETLKRADVTWVVMMMKVKRREVSG